MLARQQGKLCILHQAVDTVRDSHDQVRLQSGLKRQ